MNLRDACEHGRWEAHAEKECRHGFTHMHVYSEWACAGPVNCAGGRLIQDALVVPASGEFTGDDYEILWCKKHYSLARRFLADDSGGCWWEDIVEASGDHRPEDFVPLLDALADASKEKPYVP